MLNQGDYINELKVLLSELDPYKVLLFGSFASGNTHKDSDIDLIVVTNDSFIPANFKEKHEIYLRISRHIRPINLKVPIDLIVYTRPMYEIFIKQNSSFARDISKNAKVIYERPDKTMA